MPVPWNQRKTKPRNIGLDDELWQLIGQLADQSGTGHTAVIREWAEYAVRRRRAIPPRLARQVAGPGPGA